MAAPTTELRSQETGTITATGEASGLLIPVGTSIRNPRVFIGISGTFTSATFKARGKLRGLTNYFPIVAKNAGTGLSVDLDSGVTLTNSTNVIFEMEATARDDIEIWFSAGTLTDVDLECYITSADPSERPMVVSTVAGQQTFTGNTGVTGTLTVTSTSATAAAVGANGATNPVLLVDANTASVATGVKITGAAEAGGVAVAAISSGTDEALSLNSKGAGALAIQGTATGAVTIGSTSGGILGFGNVGTKAAAGSAQGNATAITNQITYVTASDGAKGVALPAAAAGLVRVVYNTVASQGLLVYPASGDDINDGTTDEPITIEGKSMAMFFAMDATSWGAMYTADS